MDDYLDPKPIANLMAAELDRTGHAEQKCMLNSHADDLAAELRARGYNATSNRDWVYASTT